MAAKNIRFVDLGQTFFHYLFILNLSNIPHHQPASPDSVSDAHQKVIFRLPFTVHYP
jgi:hypothetical protein